MGSIVGAFTRAPPRLPRRIEMSDSDCRMRSASRNVGRETPYCSMRVASGGNDSPSASSPVTIWRRTASATNCAAVGMTTCSLADTLRSLADLSRPSGHPLARDAHPLGDDLVHHL